MRGNHPTPLKLFGNKGDGVALGGAGTGWRWQGVDVAGGRMAGGRIEKE